MSKLIVTLLLGTLLYASPKLVLTAEPPAASSTATADSPELAAFKKAIRAKYDMKEKAFAAHDAATIVTKFYAEDARSVGEGYGVFKGRAQLWPLYEQAVKELRVKVTSRYSVVKGDAGWDWEDYRQFFRLFYKEEDRAQATICLNEQNDLSFYYLRISSRAHDGIIWTTWNYPLSYGLKLTPRFKINRQRPDQSFWQLYQSHREFLRQNQVETSVIDPMDEDRIQLEVENDLRDQIAHNLQKGVLKSTETGEVKYSWRGMVYLWCQFLLDLVRL